MSTFFVSHAVADSKKLVPAFVDLLNSGMNISYDDILCTSNGNLLTGDYFVNEIGRNILKSDVVFFLLSPNFFNSNFCLCEMGAAWILGKELIPIMVPPSSFKELESTPLKGLQARRVHILKDIVEVCDQLISRGHIKPNLNRMNEKINEFIKRQPWPSTSLNGSLTALANTNNSTNLGIPGSGSALSDLLSQTKYPPFSK